MFTLYRAAEATGRSRKTRVPYHARGVDEDGYADWISHASGEPEAYPHDDPDLDFNAWYRAHNWVLSSSRIGTLSRAAARLGQPVYLCGVAFGQAPEEFAEILSWQADFEAAYRGFGAVIIDATRPLSEVVDEVVRVSLGYTSAEPTPAPGRNVAALYSRSYAHVP